MTRINGTGDFTPRGLNELKAWLEPWFRTKLGIGGHVIQDEGIDLPQRGHLNFAGAGVTATDDPPDTTLVTIPGVTPGVPTLSETILALTGLDAFWKLNETTGTVAADSSGNGYDLASYGAAPATLPPLWGQAAGPPGETSAEFSLTRGLTRVHHTGYTANFTMLGWFRRSTGSHFDALAGQGFEGNSNSWGLVISNGSGTTDKLIAQVGTTAAIASNSTLTNSTWYMAALTRGASTWHLYVNGVQQTGTSTASPGTVPTQLWLGNDNFSSLGSRYFEDGREAYWALIGRELAAAEILAIYTAAGAAGQAAAGMVLTNPGLGGDPYWAYPTIEVTY